MLVNKFTASLRISMPTYYKIVDASPLIQQNYFKMVFIRNERVRDRISIWRWIWLCLVEILFGKELLESFVITASNSGSPEAEDLEREYGEPNQLNLHIPSGWFTNIFRGAILQVLYYKYYLQYLLILPLGEPIENEETNTITTTRVRFRLRKSLLYLIIPFRRVYICVAIAAHIVTASFSYWVTPDIWIAVIVGGTLEFFRRILKL